MLISQNRLQAGFAHHKQAHDSKEVTPSVVTTPWDNACENEVMRVPLEYTAVV
jgi:hypothetical protein